MRPDVAVFYPYFLPAAGRGGAERVSCLLAEGFARRGARVDFIAVNLEGQWRSDALRFSLPESILTSVRGPNFSPSTSLGE